jgi:hypothetical protein
MLQQVPGGGGDRYGVVELTMPELDELPLIVRFLCGDKELRALELALEVRR